VKTIDTRSLRARTLTIVFGAAVALPMGAWAHHSEAGMDLETVVTIEGTVSEYSWRNPHVYIAVDVPNQQGGSTEWVVQTGPIVAVSRRGWTASTLVPGEKVVVGVHPARDGRSYGLLSSVEKQDGTVLARGVRPGGGTPTSAPPETASTDNLNGLWFANRAELTAYPGGFDGFFRANMRLTEAGAAAVAAYDPLSTENPESRCIGRPTPAMIVASDLYPIQIEIDESARIVYIRSGFWDEERTVYMDGRSHPDIAQRFASGHSIGHWDGDTLVVDTSNFTDHRSPYQIGVPSGAGKHVVERYRLNDEGTRVTVDFVLEDPQYLAAPVVHTRELIYSPQMEMPRYDCDPTSTSRFVVH
jgi:hypothetical protein